MSGICGQFNLNEAPVTDSDLRAMTAMLERRGPERTDIWRSERCGFGHTLLATTPELKFERQPFVHANTGCAITADVRLDNRDQLLAALDLSDRHESIGDAELILRGYLEWGDACLGRLLGDFAFAIYDPRYKKLFCARDHFGMRPIYYHFAAGRRFVFGSSTQSILVLQHVPYQISDARIADFLVPELEWIDYTSTFFEDVFRLPPGHTATATAAGLEVREYWQPAPGPDPGNLTDEGFSEGFLEVFTQAVECRLRVPDSSVGTMMSGGMDSGSATAVAKDLLAARGDDPLRTYSAVRKHDEHLHDCSESKAIYAAAKMPALSPIFIHPDDVQHSFTSLIADNEEPFDAECMLLKAVYAAAHANGSKVVMDGAGGDVVFAEGSYIIRLLRSGNFSLAIRETLAESKFWQDSPRSYFFRYFASAFVPDFVKKSVRQRRKHRGHRKSLRESLISSKFAHRVDINDRFERLARTFTSGWTPDYAVERCNAIRPNMTGGRERYARLAATCAVEAVDPFLDQRVVDYLTRLPCHLRLRDGWPKIMLREVMAKRLPDEVRWSRGKPHLGWMFNAGMTAHAIKSGQLDEKLLQDTLRDYVDPLALSAAWREFSQSGDAERIHSAYVLAKWLRDNESRPVVPV